jgi:hypothetical protein
VKRPLLLLTLLLTGCASTPNRDATLYLIQHPEFEAAAKAAPRWVEQALAEITELESELSRKR